MRSAAAGRGSAAAAPNSSEPRPRPLRVALIGNPNTGKSTVFNALTGMRQRVGNFPGVTVERLEGSYRDPDGRRVEVLDLPGVYSLAPHTPDEAIALDVLLGRARGVDAPDVVVVVVDAQNLERNLFLTSQIVELGRPTVVALNQFDAAERRGIRIDVPELIHELGVTVIPTVATRGGGIDRLRHAIAIADTLPRPESSLGPATGDGDPLGADAAARRYEWITNVVARTVSHPGERRASGSDRVDAVLLHRVWGPLIFLALMAVMFQAIFSWAQPLMNAMQGMMGWLGTQVATLLPAGDLRSLLVDGVIGGVGSVLVFLPQIAILFLFIGLLEDSGYMARAAFIMDRYMRRVGLHGRSFIPLLSGYACAVPAIMSTRTIDHPKDRMATIMVVPLMSCSARLPVYTLLIGAFVPAVTVAGIFDLRGVTLFGMYLLGTVAALVAASVFKRTLLRGPARPLIIEMPPYRLPRARHLLATVMQRAMLFVRRAGTIILALSVVLWAMAEYPKSPAAVGDSTAAHQEAQLEYSALGRVGHAIEPAVRPLGYDWKIGVSMAASFAAREVFVSTMGTIYGVGGDGSTTQAALREKLRSERNPVTGRAAYTPLVAVGLMVFYVFALMCMSTVAVTVREAGGGLTGLKWAAVQFGYMLALAYGAAWLVYHGGRALGL